MENIDLFRFKFVDREIERQVIENFFWNSKTDKALWIHGVSGIGKTELIKFFSSYYQHYKFIHINPIRTNVMSYFSILSKELDKEPFSLPNFILKNYKKIRDLAKDTIFDINTKTKILSGLLDIGEKIFIDENNNFFSIANVITRYICNISMHQPYIFVFDNFQECDSNSLEIIQEITKNLLGTNNIKFIFITTDEILPSDSEIIKFLLEKICTIQLLIGPFQKKEYFLDILINIFSLDNITSSELEQLFQVCKGVPEKLKIFLRNMYLSNGIEYYKNQKQARLLLNIYKEVLSKGVENTDFDSLNIFEKLVFKIVICWNESIPISLLQNISLYVAQEVLCLPSELNSQIINAIHKLLGLNILEMDEYGLKVKHDLLYVSYLSKYDVIPEVILYNKLFNFINTNKNLIIELYTETFYDINNSLYSYKANISSWEQINLSCLKTLLTQSDFNNIKLIIDRLETSLANIGTSDLILLAECFYNSGKYDNARNILNYSKKKLRTNKEYFRYYYLSAKLYNMIMDKGNAETELLSAQKYVLPKTDKYILVKHMLQLILVEVNGRKQEAKSIFCSISEHLNDYEHNSRALGILLKNCSNYYSGANALRLLEKALRISEDNGDIVEKAFIKNNMGFEYFKLNDYKKCKCLYKESIDILNQTKIHESSYPLSNLAVCYMIDNKFDDAITLIKRAFFWNRSAYMEFVLYTHLMLCYEQIGEKDESYAIANMLLQKMNNKKIEDPVILRKVYLNLAINYDKLSYKSHAKACAEKAYMYSRGSSSEYRATKIYSKYFEQADINLPVLKEPYYTKHYFDHWLTIFSHD